MDVTAAIDAHLNQDENQVKKTLILIMCPMLPQSQSLENFIVLGTHLKTKKGGTTLKVLPAMCERNDLEEHLFVFLKRTSLNGFICALNKADKFWIHEDDIVKELATPELTRRRNQ